MRLLKTLALSHTPQLTFFPTKYNHDASLSQEANPFDSGWLILKGLQQMPDPIFYVQTFFHNFFFT